MCKGSGGRGRADQGHRDQTVQRGVAADGRAAAARPTDRCRLCIPHRDGGVGATVARRSVSVPPAVSMAPPAGTAAAAVLAGQRWPLGRCPLRPPGGAVAVGGPVCGGQRGEGGVRGGWRERRWQRGGCWRRRRRRRGCFYSGATPVPTASPAPVQKASPAPAPTAGPHSRASAQPHARADRRGAPPRRQRQAQRPWGRHASPTVGSTLTTGAAPPPTRADTPPGVNSRR